MKNHTYQDLPLQKKMIWQYTFKSEAGIFLISIFFLITIAIAYASTISGNYYSILWGLVFLFSFGGFLIVKYQANSFETKREVEANALYRFDFKEDEIIVTNARTNKESVIPYKLVTHTIVKKDYIYIILKNTRMYLLKKDTFDLDIESVMLFLDVKDFRIY